MVNVHVVNKVRRKVPHFTYFRNTGLPVAIALFKATNQIGSAKITLIHFDTAIATSV